MSNAQHATELGKFLSRFYVAECKVQKDVFLDTLLAACDTAQASAPFSGCDGLPRARVRRSGLDTSSANASAREHT